MGNFNNQRGSRVYPSQRTDSGGTRHPPRFPGRPLLLVSALAAGALLFTQRGHFHFPAAAAPAANASAASASAPTPALAEATPLPVTAASEASPVSRGSATLAIPEDVPPRVSADSHTIARGESLYDAMIAEGFSREQVMSLVKTAKPFADLTKVHPGLTFSVWHTADVSGFGASPISSIQFTLAPNKFLVARPTAQGFDIANQEIPYTSRLASYEGEVDSSLWEAAVKARMDPNLIASLADVFTYDVDFNTEVRKGDRFRLVVEQRLLDGKPAGFGDILAAEYVNAGDSHQAIRFENAAGDADYFAASGNSLRRMFLRSPLKYRRISSRFSSNRFHPILHENRAHQGVDYAADVGTPIRAVGDGVIERAELNGGSGNFVKIRHNSTYETSYSHLSAYGPGVKAGIKVRQGQIIGYVGQTGLATGPHLHFAFYEKGVYVDPLSKRFPAADPIAPGDKARFEEALAKLLPLLPAWTGDSPSPAVAGIAVHPAMLAPSLPR